MVYLTSLSSDNVDSNFREIVYFCNSNFDVKRESCYVNLANSLFEYLSLVKYLRSLNHELDVNISTIEFYNAEILRLQDSIEEATKNIQACLLGGELKTEDFLALTKESRSAYLDKKTQNDFETKIPRLRCDVTNININYSLFQKKLEIAIEEIKENLRTLRRLDKPDELKFGKNKVINSLPAVKDEMAYQMIEQYILGRKKAFGIIEDFSLSVIEAYQRRELLENIKESEVAEFMLAYQVLEAFQLHDSNFRREYFMSDNIDKVNSFLMPLQVINRYFETGEIQSEQYSKALCFRQNFKRNDALRFMTDAKEKKSKENKQLVKK